MQYEIAQVEIWLFQGIDNEGNKWSSSLWSLWCSGEVSSHLPAEFFSVGADMKCPQPFVEGKINTAGHHFSNLVQMSREK